MQIRTIIVLLFTLSLSVLPVKAGVEVQPRIVTLKDKVESLESEYGVRFVYSSDINLERPYIGGRPDASENTVESGSAEGLEAALDRVFRGTGISWKKHRRYIMLGLEPPIEVRDSIRTMAGTDGIPERNDTIAESRITTDRYIREINRTQTGLTRIDGEKFNRGFAFLSSPDLIKTIQSLPGVAGGTELMSGLYVHGGTGTDNLFLLDGVPLYQVSHLAGLFSSFNTDVVESVDFYKSGFPARYGGRLSSVVDVRTREGDFEEYHGLFSIGLIDGRLQYEGPIVRGKTSFNVAMRRSRYRFILFKLSPEFYDSIKAWYNRSYNLPYVEYVMSSPSFVYTNIRRGLGFFGAVNVSVSEWMDNPGDMKDMGPYSESM